MPDASLATSQQDRLETGSACCRGVPGRSRGVGEKTGGTKYRGPNGPGPPSGGGPGPFTRAGALSRPTSSEFRPPDPGAGRRLGAPWAGHAVRDVAVGGRSGRDRAGQIDRRIVDGRVHSLGRDATVKARGPQLEQFSEILTEARAVVGREDAEASLISGPDSAAIGEPAAQNGVGAARIEPAGGFARRGFPAIHRRCGGIPRPIGGGLTVGR
jgi:hypothetical protein